MSSEVWIVIGVCGFSGVWIALGFVASVVERREVERREAEREKKRVSEKGRGA